MVRILRLAPSIEMTHRVTAATTAYTISRMRILERIPGNPVGIAYRQVGDATALSALNLPSPSFNSVVGLSAGQTSEIESLVQWYRDRGQAARFEIAAGDYDPSLGRELTRLGFFQSGFHAALIGECEQHATAPIGIAVKPVRTAAAMEDFLTAYVAGWGILYQIREQFKANVRPWVGRARLVALPHLCRWEARRYRHPLCSRRRRLFRRLRDRPGISQEWSSLDATGPPVGRRAIWTPLV